MNVNHQYSFFFFKHGWGNDSSQTPLTSATGVTGSINRNKTMLIDQAQLVPRNILETEQCLIVKKATKF